MSLNSYQQAQDYLYGLIPNRIELGLGNTQKLLQHFGDPHLGVPTVHIAGTNGKGSTAAFAESILRASGVRTGLYTSPHLNHLGERFRVNGRPIEEDALARWVFRIRDAVDTMQLPVTYFEFCTVLAFLHFKEMQTEWNVIEVGMGGRLDATNLCEPVASIITSIGLDHTRHLGDTLEAIAFEKASIIKPNGMVFAHVEQEAAARVVENFARERNAVLRRFGKEFHARVVENNFRFRGQTIDFSYEAFHFENLKIPLIGSHQVTNASLALAACLESLDLAGGVDAAAVREGLAATRWEGRMEVVCEQPAIVLDCAHNPDGIRKLVQSVRESFTWSRCTVVFGCMKDKPVAEMLETLSPLADHFILVKPSQERSEDPERLKTLIKNLEKPVDIIEQISYALRTARHIAKPKDLIVVTGSLFTISEAKSFFVDEAAH